MVERRMTNPLGKDEMRILEACDVEVDPFFLFPDGNQRETQATATRKFKAGGKTWSVEKKLNGGRHGVTFLVGGDEGRRFVIKFLERANDPELELLMSIPYAAWKHPNLCQYFFIARNIGGKFPRLQDIGGTSPEAMVCMQAIPNGELFDLIQAASTNSSAFSEETIRHFAHDIIKGMAELATHHVTHGDLKPENLLVDSSATVIIIDMGSAKKHVVCDAGTRQPFFATNPRPESTLMCQQQTRPQTLESTVLVRLKEMTKDDLKTTARKNGIEEDALANADANVNGDPSMSIMNLILDKFNTSLLAQLRIMTLKTLKAKALEDGVETETVTDVDDQDDPKEKIIQLILCQKSKTSMAQLERLTLHDLKRKAREGGAGNDAVDNVDGENDPKLAIMNLILDKEIDPHERDSELWAMLKRMEPGDLKKRALEHGIDERSLDDVGVQAMIQLILQVNAPVLAPLQRMTWGGLKKKASKEGLATDIADEALDPKQKVIQLILDKKAVELETDAKKACASAPVATPALDLLCERNRALELCTTVYNPPERGISDPYDCARGDVFTVGLIILMMIWAKMPDKITNNGKGIIEEGLAPEQWKEAERTGATFSAEIKNLLNAMLRKDPKRRPTWAELADACNQKSPREELKWLSFPLSEPLQFFVELKKHNPSIAKHLSSKDAVEALLGYVKRFEEPVRVDDDRDRVKAGKAFEEANTKHNGKLTAKELHEAIWQNHRKYMNATEMDLASLMCRFTQQNYMEEEDFKTMWTHMSSNAHEVAPIVGRNKSRYHAWKTCGSSEIEECRKFVLAICQRTRDFLKYELWPEEAKNKNQEDGRFHICFSLEDKELCYLQCNLFRMGDKIILESRRQFGSAVEERGMLGAIEDAINHEWRFRVKPPVVLTEEWLWPAMLETRAFRVGEAQQQDGYEHVVLKNKPNGWNVTKVPNGESIIILDEEDDSCKVKWTTVEGWAKKQNVIKIENVSPPVDSKLRDELRAMTLKDLKTKARLYNIDDNTISDVDEAAEPKEAIIEHILQAHTDRVELGPSTPIIPTTANVERRVFAQRSFDMIEKSGVNVAHVRQGDSLVIVKEEGTRVRVRKGKPAAEGWASKEDVGEHPPWKHSMATGFFTK